MRRTAIALLLALAAASAAARDAAAQTHPILFVTQTPNGDDFANGMSTFGNHRGERGSAPRGGDLWIRYPDGSRRNLTAEAGFGLAPGQEIAVRDPAPHWSGARALFSMVIGGTTQNDYDPVYFQIYEVTGLGQGQPVAIRRLSQPADTTTTCEAFAAEIASNNTRALSLVQQQSNTNVKNVGAAVVGVLIFPPLLLAMDLSGADGVELQALRARNEHIASLMRQRNCANIPPASPEAAQSKAIDDRIRESGKSGVQPNCRDVGGYEAYKQRTGEICKL